MKFLRRLLASVAAVLAVLALTTTQIVRVAYSQAFDTDSFVELSGRLITTPEMRSRIADSLVEQLVGEAKIGQSLDKRALRVIGMSAEEVNATVAEAVRTAVGVVLRSDQFAALWSVAVRDAHESLIQAINAEASTPQPVTVDLSPVMNEIATALVDTSGALPVGIKPSRVVPAGSRFTFDFISSGTVDTISQAASTARALRTAGAIASVVLLCAAIILPVRRRNGVRLAAMTVALSGLFVLTARASGTGAVETAAGENSAIGVTVYRAVTSPLAAPAVALIVLAGLAMTATFLRRGQSGNT